MQINHSYICWIRSIFSYKRKRKRGLSKTVYHPVLFCFSCDISPPNDAKKFSSSNSASSRNSLHSSGTIVVGTYSGYNSPPPVVFKRAPHSKTTYKEALYYYKLLMHEFVRVNTEDCSIFKADKDNLVIKYEGKKFSCQYSALNMRNVYLEFHNCNFNCAVWVDRQESGEFANFDYTISTPTK